MRAKLATTAKTGEKLIDVEMRNSQEEIEEEVDELEILPPLVLPLFCVAEDSLTLLRRLP